MVRVPARDVILHGTLQGGNDALGIVVFVDEHGRATASSPLGAALAERVVMATDWLGRDWEMWSLGVGYVGTGVAAGAALVAASERPAVVGAVVCCGGRPDLAGPALPRVKAPTLLLVGDDAAASHLSQATHGPSQPRGTRYNARVPPGVARRVRLWFERHFGERAGAAA